jgi:hypothetical protein
MTPELNLTRTERMLARPSGPTALALVFSLPMLVEPPMSIAILSLKL